MSDTNTFQYWLDIYGNPAYFKNSTEYCYIGVELLRLKILDVDDRTTEKNIYISPTTDQAIKQWLVRNILKI